MLDDGITMMRGSLRRYAILLLSLYSAISSNDIWLRRLAITFLFSDYSIFDAFSYILPPCFDVSILLIAPAVFRDAAPFMWQVSMYSGPQEHTELSKLYLTSSFTK